MRGSGTALGEGVGPGKGGGGGLVPVMGWQQSRQQLGLTLQSNKAVMTLKDDTIALLMATHCPAIVCHVFKRVGTDRIDSHNVYAARATYPHHQQSP